MPVSASFRLPTAVLLLVSLGGCGTQIAPPSGPARGIAQAADTPSQAADTPLGFLNGVGLSAAQTTAIKAIAERGRAASDPSANRSARAQRFAALLTAPTLDEAALAAFFRQDLQTAAKARADLVGMYVAIHAILTPTQRVAAADAIQAELARPATPPSAAPAEPGGETPEGQLTLSAEQQALFAATVAPPPAPRAVLTALSTLIRTGEKAPLEAALAPKSSLDAQVAALVKAFASLTPAQRRQMAGGGQER